MSCTGCRRRESEREQVKGCRPTAVASVRPSLPLYFKSFRLHPESNRGQLSYSILN